MIHDTVVDTSVVYPHRLGPPYKRALRNLMADHLNKIIQDDGWFILLLMVFIRLILVLQFGALHLRGRLYCSFCDFIYSRRARQSRRCTRCNGTYVMEN